MGTHYNPKVVTTNLLLAVDAANIKSYDYTENLMPWSDLQAGGWAANNAGAGIAAIYTANTTAVMDPKGGYNAANVTQYGTGYQRIAIGVATPDANVPHTWSVYVKQGNYGYAAIENSGNWASTGGHVIFNFSTKTFTYDGGNQNPGYQDVGNGWYRIWGTFTPGTTAGTFWLWPGEIAGSSASNGYYTYYYGAQIERGNTANKYVSSNMGSPVTRSNTIYNMVNTTGNTFTILNNGYYYPNNNAITFTRSDTANASLKFGSSAVMYTSGSLAASSFIYNDHTWEVWFKINDKTSGGQDATENYSAIMNYRGYHSGFQYTADTVYYIVWDGGTSYYTYWSLGNSGSQINTNTWYQIAVTRIGNTFTPYVNGVQLGTGFTQSISVNASVQNTLCIASPIQVTSPTAGGYNYFPKMTFGLGRMYNRGLTPAEIKQNFFANRNRFNI